MANVQRVGMTPGMNPGAPGTRPAAANQPTIVLARPGQQMTPAGAGAVRTFQGRPGSIMAAGGVRVGASGPRVPVQVPTVAGGGNLVINNPGLAPGQPGSQITVPLQALQGLQPGQGIPTGQAGHLLVKTENNQYQIIRVDSSTAAPSSSSTSVPTSSTVRQAVPPSPLPPPIRSVAPPARPVTVPKTTASGSSGGSSSSSSSSSAGGMGGQMTPDTAKHKCKNFLATLLRLAGEQPAHVAQNVRNLIQGLIDGKVEPETFTSRLQQELNSSPQPCLVPFLKKSLPYLQSSLQSGELTIDGVRAPPRLVAHPGGPVVRPPGSGVMYPPQPRGLAPQIRARMTATLPRSPVQPVHRMTGTTVRQATPSKPLPVGAGKSPFQPSTTIHKIASSAMPVTAHTKANIAANNFVGTTISKKPVPPSSYSGGDEDVNDVPSMAGINLDEEVKKMAGPADVMAALRSCKDETFLQTGLLHERVARICRSRGLDEPPIEVIQLVSHATQERLKTLLEKLAVISEHRLDVVRAADESERYEVSQDVRGQLKFLSELDKMERKRHDEAERELLFRAAKSRTKTEDPEKEKLKLKAKELQRFEEEQLKHEKANSTARLAIGGPGPRKKLKTEELGTGSGFAASGTGSLANRPRIKRVHLRDLLFLMEQERGTKRSPLLWKAFSS